MKHAISVIILNVQHVELILSLVYYLVMLIVQDVITLVDVLIVDPNTIVQE